jgi:hypothetical protein
VYSVHKDKIKNRKSNTSDCHFQLAWVRMACGTFQTDTAGTFESDIAGTFESDMGGTFAPLLSPSFHRRLNLIRR